MMSFERSSVAVKLAAFLSGVLFKKVASAQVSYLSVDVVGSTAFRKSDAMVPSGSCASSPRVHVWYVKFCASLGMLGRYLGSVDSR
jgi:hypothetical protein